ncbi:MAG: PEP-CTERM-box response regulator transcription factor [Candidatus Omnitrophica bacterium]|nr:PEP-CTERM-box response regulator transcription factor [Candidatus Omnitrophota bacterium]
MERAKILIVDDDEGILKQLKWALQDEYEVETATSKEQALAIAREIRPNLLALDINLDGANFRNKEGMDILEALKTDNPFLKVVMITGNDSKELALEAITRGADDYYLKPVNIDELKIIFRRALHMQELEIENKRLNEEIHTAGGFESMIGDSPKMQDIFKLIRRVAPSDATVLITGESGTGKELVAQALHQLSPRNENPFMVINCGAIPENLLESELFGHEKGSFTDAHVKRIGKLEAAHGGTVFLDEIGEMSLNLQVKILRFLQERTIERVGGNIPLELDVRVIVATNCDLKKKIKDGSFREDLYYRLSVINIELPPLRERGDDAYLLAKHFLQHYRQEAVNKDIKGFSKEAKDFIKSYVWPGNIREMENRVRRAVILAENSLITPQELGFGKENELDDAKEKLNLKDARQELEINLIKKALSDSGNNMTLAAKMLGITRPTFYDLMKKYGIEVAE